MLMQMLRRLLFAWPRPQSTPAATEALRTQAVALHRDGKLSEAEAAYRAILGQHPGDAAALGLLGHCLTLQGRYAESVEVLRRAFASDPGSAETLFNLVVAAQMTHLCRYEVCFNEVGTHLYGFAQVCKRH